jgi:hypothetical protein
LAHAALAALVASSLALSAVSFPRAAASAQAAPKDLTVPTPSLHFAQPTIYTLSISSDAITNARMAVELAHLMNLLYQNPHLFVPAPSGWSINDFLVQCSQERSGILGALIVMPPSIVAGVQSHVLYRTSYADIGLFAVAANCDNPSPNALGGTVVWRSEYHSKSSSAATFTFFYPILAALSLYVAIAPQKAYATTTTVVHPTPSPTPKPGGEYISQTQQQTTTTINGSGTSGITNGLVGSSENYVNNATSVSQTDPVTAKASLLALRDVALDLAKACGKDPNLLGPEPHPVGNSAFVPSTTPFDKANVCTWGSGTL